VRVVTVLVSLDLLDGLDVVLSKKYVFHFSPQVWKEVWKVRPPRSSTP
jgi:hypothetical protein